MSDCRGRPHSTPRASGAAALSGPQRLLLGAVVNVVALAAWAAQALDREVRHNLEIDEPESDARVLLAIPDDS